MSNRIVAVAVCACLVWVGVASAATVAEKKTAIDAGITWLASQQNANGSWAGDYGYTAQGTGMVVLTLAEDELDRQAAGAPDAGENLAQIRSGLKWLLENASTSGVPVQPMGNPDVNGNGRGIHWGSQAEYVSGFTVPAVIKAAQALGINTVPADFSQFTGESISTVVQDTVDYLAYGQVDPSQGINRGGWRYGANYPNSDNSVSQFPALALLYAQAAGASVPNFVKSELAMWINAVDNADGGSDYTPGDGSFSHGDWLGRAGGLVIEKALAGGDPSANLAFINAYWQHQLNLPNPPTGNSPYTLWANYKACEAAIGLYNNGPIANLRWNFAHGGGNFDDPNHATWNWWEDYCEYLVTIQAADGRWPQTAGTGHLEHDNVVTAIGVNILRGLEVPAPPIPEPMTMSCALLGLAGLARYIRRRK